MSKLRALIEQELAIGDKYRVPLLRMLEDGALFPEGWTWDCGGDPYGGVELWIMSPDRAIVFSVRGPLADVIRQTAVFFVQHSLLLQERDIKNGSAIQHKKA